MRVSRLDKLSGPLPSSPSMRANILAGFIVCALAIALCYHGLLHLMGLRYPWDTFLYLPYDRFDDWFSSAITAATHDPYVKSKGSYFPFAYLLLAVDIPVTNFTNSAATVIASYASYVAISVGLIAGGVLLFWRNTFETTGAQQQQWKSPATLAVLLFICFAAYPALYGFDRGNLDTWIGGLMLIYIAELRKPSSWIGAVALAVAIALKGYPLALILLGLQQRQYKSVTFSVALAIILTVLAFTQFISSPLTNWHAFQQRQHEFWLYSVLGSSTMVDSSDPYNALRGLAWIALHAWQQIHAPAATMQLNTANAQHIDFHEHAKFLKSVGGANSLGARTLFANAYVGLTTLFAAVSAFFVLFVPSQAWKRVAVVAVVIMVYPHVAIDYKLIVLLPVALTLMVEPALDSAHRKAFWLVALLLIPKSYLFFYGIGITMILNPVFLLMLWGVAIWQPESWRQCITTFRMRVGALSSAGGAA